MEWVKMVRCCFDSQYFGTISSAITIQVKLLGSTGILVADHVVIPEEYMNDRPFTGWGHNRYSINLKEKTTKIVGLTVIGFQPFHSQSKWWSWWFYDYKNSVDHKPRGLPIFSHINHNNFAEVPTAIKPMSLMSDISKLASLNFLSSFHCWFYVSCIP